MLVIRDLVLPLASFQLEVTLELTAPTTALYGPSGAGKTSLLELLCGLRRPLSGTIEINGRTVTAPGVFVPPRQRQIGYVPQDDALFPHLSVRQNVFYGAKAERADVIDALEIRPLLDRGVKRLSGGERKRVALARALHSDPEVLLLDEPLSGVDLALRGRVLDHLNRAREAVSIPVVYVTHHLDEAEAVCDELVVLDRGRIIEQRPL